MTYASPSTINASLGLGEVFSYLNTVTNYWISNLFLLGIWFLIVVGYYKAQDDFPAAMAVAGYGTFVVALLFWLGGFASNFALSISIGAAILGTLVLFMDKQ